MLSQPGGLLVWTGEAVKDNWDEGIRAWAARVVAASCPRACVSSAHNTPEVLVLKPGVYYTITCPACGETSTFTVEQVT